MLAEFDNHHPLQAQPDPDYLNGCTVDPWVPNKFTFINKNAYCCYSPIQNIEETMMKKTVKYISPNCGLTASLLGKMEGQAFAHLVLLDLGEGFWGVDSSSCSLFLLLLLVSTPSDSSWGQRFLFPFLISLEGLALILKMKIRCELAKLESRWVNLQLCTLSDWESLCLLMQIHWIRQKKRIGVFPVSRLTLFFHADPTTFFSLKKKYYTS